MEDLDVVVEKARKEQPRRGGGGRRVRAALRGIFILIVLGVLGLALWRGTWWALAAWIITAIFLIDVSLTVLFGLYDEPKARSLGFLYWIASVFLGRKAVQLVSPDGQVRTVQPTEPLASIFAKLGAPGIVIIDNGAAALFERSGRFTRVVGPGVALTQRFEKVAHVVDLRPQLCSKKIRKIMSRDGLSFDLSSLDLIYKVAADFDPRRGEYAFSEESLLDLVFRGGFLYKDGERVQLSNRVLGIVEFHVRNVAAEYTLAELIRMEEDHGGDATARSRLLDEVRRRAEPDLKQIGIELHAVDIGEIVVPGELHDLLTLPLRQIVDLGLAHTQRDAIVGIAEGLKQAVFKFESSVPEDAKEALPHLLLNLTDSLQQLSDRFMGLARPYREGGEGWMLPAGGEEAQPDKTQEEGQQERQSNSNRRPRS